MTTPITGGYVSADGHVVEPADLWTSRMDTRFRDRAPHVESRPEGDYYVIDGLKPFPVGLEGVTMEEKLAGKVTKFIGRHADTRPGANDPQARSGRPGYGSPAGRGHLPRRGPVSERGTRPRLPARMSSGLQRLAERVLRGRPGPPAGGWPAADERPNRVGNRRGPSGSPKRACARCRSRAR